jgi:plastocyanin
MRDGRAGLMALAIALAAAGCGAAGDAATVDGAPARASVSSVPATGKVIDVKMMSIGGEKFGPEELTVRRGDVVRFVLESGVHNVSFPAEVNPSGVELPDSSPYLQIPGQAHDVFIDLPAGEYTFHCDPHVFLGMVGKLTVLD